MTQRTDVLIKPVTDGVLNALTAGPQAITAFPIAVGGRPKDATGKLILPPYAYFELFPGGEMDGPLSDSQADMEFRIRIVGVGKSADEAHNVSDACTKRMHKEYISIAGRKVRTVRRVTSNAGDERDDDTATPLYFHVVIWEIDTAAT